MVGWCACTSKPFTGSKKRKYEEKHGHYLANEDFKLLLLLAVGHGVVSSRRMKKVRKRS